MEFLWNLPPPFANIPPPLGKKSQISKILNIDNYTPFLGRPPSAARKKSSILLKKRWFLRVKCSKCQNFRAPAARKKILSISGVRIPKTFEIYPPLVRSRKGAKGGISQRNSTDCFIFINIRVMHLFWGSTFTGTGISITMPNNCRAKDEKSPHKTICEGKRTES